MYTIYCDGEPMYDPADKELSITQGKVVLEVNKTGTLTFQLIPRHPAKPRIRKRTSVIDVYMDGGLLFRGRILPSESDMYGLTAYTCEGEMSYLLDSIQRPKEYHDLTPEIYLRDKLAQHNSQVEAAKRFTLGIVEKRTMNYSAREDSQYTNTLDTIMDKLVDSNGGYLRVRSGGGIRYLDYLESYGRTSGQTIRFGENILDLTEHVSAADVITVLIPLGKAPEGSAAGAKLTIASVNGGKDYLEDAEAVALYGRVEGVKEWPDVSVPANLKAKGMEYLKNIRNLVTTIELTAIDLHMVDVDIDSIRLGDMVRVVSPPHGLDRYMLVSRREYNLLDPSADRIILGDTIGTLTEKQAALQKQVERQKNSVDSIDSEARNRVKLLTEEVDAAKTEVSEISGKVQTLESGSADAEKMLQNLTDTVAGLAESGREMQEAVQSILSRLEILEGGGTD